MKLEDIVDDWAAMPPDLYFKLKKVIDNPRSSFKAIGEVILHDPALSARILKVANSPFFNPGFKIESIDRALTFIGMNQLEELVLGTAVMESFKDIPTDLIDINAFWKHSIGCALGARLIAEHIREPDKDRFFLLGILHDIGSLIIYKKSPKAAQKALELSEKNSEFLFQVETQIHGFNHADVAASLFRLWKLPEELVQIIAKHHIPTQSKTFSKEVSIIYLADLLAHGLHLRGTGEGFTPPIDDVLLNNLWKDLWLTPKDISDLQKQLKDQFKETVLAFLS